MIVDCIENRGLYQAIGEGINQGLNYIANTNLNELEPGKYELPNGLMAIVAAYEPKNATDCVIESHRKYIDIQYIISGSEQMGFTSLEKKVATTPYNEEKDVAFYKENVSMITFYKGMFAIYFPEDIHMPGVYYKGASAIKKVVVKVPVNL